MSKGSEGIPLSDKPVQSVVGPFGIEVLILLNTCSYSERRLARGLSRPGRPPHGSLTTVICAQV